MPSNRDEKQLLELFSLILDMSDNFYQLKKLNFLVENIGNCLEYIPPTEQDIEKANFYIQLHEKEYQQLANQLASDFDLLCEKVKQVSKTLKGD